MKKHEGIFVVLAPSPSFRDVVSIVKADEQVMLVALGRRLQVPAPRTSELSFLTPVMRDPKATRARATPSRD